MCMRLIAQPWRSDRTSQKIACKSCNILCCERKQQTGHMTIKDNIMERFFIHFSQHFKTKYDKNPE